MTISNSNSFDLFSYGSESVFWYFQFQRLISDFSDNPLKLHKIPAYYLKNPLKLHKIPAYYLKFSQTEIYVFHFAKKARFVRFGVNGTTFLQDIQRKKSKQKGGKKKKSGEKKQKEKKMSDKKVPCPPHTPLLSTSHHRSLRPHYRFGSQCPWILIYLEIKKIK